MKMTPWPLCPSCGKKRVAVCRFCHTYGDDFPPADMEYVLPKEETPSEEDEPEACEKHAGGCGCSRGGLKLSDPLDATPDYDPETEEACPLMVMCPECGELITPRFLKTCTHCEHEFPDGVENHRILTDESQANSGRVLAAVAVMAAVLGGLAYVMFMSL